MGGYAGPVRNPEALERTRILLRSYRTLLANGTLRASCAEEYFRLREVLVGQYTMMTALQAFCEAGGGSRGSAVYLAGSAAANPFFDPDVKVLPAPPQELLRGAFLPRCAELERSVQEVVFDECADGKPTAATATLRPVRPLPEGGGFFETVWRRYREQNGEPSKT
jgi:hypothetical protein